MVLDISSREGLLRKEHYLAGFSLNLDDHVITLRRHGEVLERFGIYTLMEDVHHYIDQLLNWESSGIEFRGS
jgi:hypothetical protein